MKKFYLLGGMAVATALIAAASAFPTASPNEIGGGKTSDYQDVTEIYADPAPQADAAASVPYYSQIAVSASAFDTGWTIIDHNSDNVKWATYSDSSSPTKFAARMSSWAPSSSTQDDYLISPLIHLEAGVEYAAVYNFRAHSASNVENMTVYLTKGNTAADVESEDKVKLNEHLDYTVTTYNKFAPTFTVTESGDYCIAFWCHSPGNKYYVYVADLLVTKNEFTPNSVSGLTATAAAERELKCTLAWSLPTDDVFGNAIPDDKAISAVKVYRDGGEEPIATLGADAVTFDDTESTGLTSGKHTYAVSVVAGGIESAQASVGPTDYVGPVEASAVPVKFDIESQSDFGLWTVLKGENATDDTNTWAYSSSYLRADYQLKYNTTDDGWLISPPVQIAEAGYYRLALEIIKANANFDPTVTLEMGNAAEIAAMTTIATVSPEQNGNSYTIITDWPVAYQDIKIDNAGVYYFAVHNNTSDITGGNYLRVHSLGVEKVSLCPNPVTELVATAASDGSLKINVSWANPEKSTVDDTLADSDYQVEVYLNDASTPAVTVDGGVTTAEVTVDKADVYTVTVKAVGKQGGASAPGAPSVKTTWVGSRVVEVPYSTEFKEDDGTRSIWEVHNLNDDDYAFTWGKVSYSNYTQMLLKGATSNNDFLVSPVFDLAAGLYKVTVSHASGGGSYEVNPVIGLIKEGTFNQSNPTGNFIATKTLYVKNYSAEDGAFTFQVTEAGKYQIVYGDDESVFNQYASIDLRGFSIAAEETYPDDVTGLTATINTDKANTIDLSWTNPSTIYDTEYTLSAISGIVVMRDGEVIATLTDNVTPGANASYSDENVANGMHIYSVYATFNGKAHEGEYPSVSTQWIGGGLTIPTEGDNPGIHHIGVFTGWYSDDIDGNHDNADGKYTWKYNSAANPSNSYWEIDQVSYNNQQQNNDYLVSCPIKFEKGAIYKISFKYSPCGYYPSQDWEMALKMGTGSDHKNFEEVGTLPFKNVSSGYAVLNHSFNVAVGTKAEAEPAPQNQIMMLADGDPTPEELYTGASKIQEGDNRLAIHANSIGGARIREFHVEKVADYEAPTTEITEVSAGKVSFDGQAVNFGGVASVQVYNLTGVCVAADSAAAGSFDVSKLGAGYYIVKVTTDSQTVTLKVTVK